MTVRSPWVTAGRSGSIAASAASASAVDIGVRGSLTRLGWRSRENCEAESRHHRNCAARLVARMGNPAGGGTPSSRSDSQLCSTVGTGCGQQTGSLVGVRPLRQPAVVAAGRRFPNPPHPRVPRLQAHVLARPRDSGEPSTARWRLSRQPEGWQIAVEFFPVARPTSPPDLCAIAVSPRFQRWVR